MVECVLPTSERSIPTYCCAPYSRFVPAQYQAKEPSVPDYTTYENVDVVFSGIGKTSVIEFQKNGSVRRLEVPNESVIVVPHSPIKWPKRHNNVSGRIR
jgi:hypothetical protein